MKKLVLFLFLVPSLVNAQPLSLYSTDSYAYFGTLANASTFLGRQNYECKITNTGKLEGKRMGLLYLHGTSLQMPIQKELKLAGIGY